MARQGERWRKRSSGLRFVLVIYIVKFNEKRGKNVRVDRERAAKRRISAGNRERLIDYFFAKTLRLKLL